MRYFLWSIGYYFGAFRYWLWRGYQCGGRCRSDCEWDPNG